VVFDDALTGRLDRCSACSAAGVAKSGSWCGLRAARPVVVVSIGLCRGCFRETRFAAAMDGLDRRFRQRYGLDEKKEAL